MIRDLFVGGTCAVTALSLLSLASPAGAAEDTARWNRGQAELQKQLPPGQPADVYRQKLQQLGYTITATNYSSDDYLEYEVVKGDQTWEVQIDVDDDTRKATAIDIAMNMWKTDATQRALEMAVRTDRTGMTATRTDRTDTEVTGTRTAMPRSEAMDDAARRQDLSPAPTAAMPPPAATATTGAQRETMRRNNRYSDRDRTLTDAMINELEALPVGRNKQFYKDALRQRGYEISKINTDDQGELELEAVKNGASVAMTVDFDEDSGQSTEVDASTLWAESESTTRTRETQERRSLRDATTSRMRDVEDQGTTATTPPMRDDDARDMTTRPSRMRDDDDMGTKSGTSSPRMTDPSSGSRMDDTDDADPTSRMGPDDDMSGTSPSTRESGQRSQSDMTTNR